MACNLCQSMLLSVMRRFFFSLVQYVGNQSFASFRGDDETEMANKINRKVTINGKTHCIRANSEQEYADKIAQLFQCRKGIDASDKHVFVDYAWNWFEIYSKPNVATVTANTYKRQMTAHLFPVLGDKYIEDITVDDIQRLFNNMNGAKTTKLKTKQVLNMIFDTALEDGFINKNPMQSKRLKISGKASKTTPEYTVEQMRFLIRNLDKIKNPVDRMYLAIQALHPLRLEEVLGLKWEDVDTENMVLHICRAVTHPDRNKPEIKLPKTEASLRYIGLSTIAAEYLLVGCGQDFVFGGDTPFSYQQVRRMCERIQRDIGFEDKITPIRFRTTVLTDIYDRTHDIKQAQAAAGHTTSAMTLKHYVKGRGNVSVTASVIDSAYGN